MTVCSCLPRCLRPITDEGQIIIIIDNVGSRRRQITLKLCAAIVAYEHPLTNWVYMYIVQSVAVRSVRMCSTSTLRPVYSVQIYIQPNYAILQIINLLYYALVVINEVTLHRARLVLGWVTV